MEYKPFLLPDQNISDSKKNKKWHLEHANLMISYITGNDYNGRLAEISKMEQKYLAEDVARPTVTSPYGEDLGQVYETYPLIEGIIDDIIGKYLSRPLKRKVYSINRDAINSKLDEKVEYIMEDIFRTYNENINKENDLDVKTENPDIELPEDIEEFFNKTYKTLAEELSDDLITQFLDVNKYKDKIKYLLTEYLFGDTCAAYMDQKNGHPELVRVRYDECYFDVDPTKEVQDDMEVFAFYKWHTENEIYNQFKLTPKEKKKVKETFTLMNDGSLLQDDIDGTLGYDGEHQNCSKGTSYKGWVDINNKDKRHRMRVMVMKWKSRRDLRTLIHKDKKTGKDIYKLLPETYKERGRDNIQITSIETIHYIKTLGPELVLEWGEVEERNGYIDNPAKATIPALALVGKTYLKANKLRSVAKKLEGLQVGASDILYQIKLLVNSTDGKVLLYDSAQVPKQFIDSYGAENAINRVFHHMKKDKVVIINSKDKKDRTTFNQFTTLDLSNRGLMKDLMDGLMLYEDLARKFIGLTKEAQEGGEKYQTATGTNHAIIASNSRLEVYFEPFDSFMGSLLNKFLQKCKSVYKDGQVFQQIFGDMQTKFMVIHREFFDSDLGLYIGNTAKDLRDKQIIDQGAQLALGSAQTPEMILDLINVLEKDNATESKAILERSVAAMVKMNEQQQQAEQQAQQQAMEAQKAEEEAKAGLVREGYAKDIEVAKIYANNKTTQANADRDADNLKTLAKLEVEQQKNAIQAESKKEPANA